MEGYEKALREYERKLTCPYDYEEEDIEDYDEYEDYMITQADYAYERERI